MLLPPTPETAAAFFGTWKCGAILLSMSVLYGDDGDPPPRVGLAGAKVLRHRRRQRRPRRPVARRARAAARGPARERRRRASTPRTRSPTTPRSSTTRPARPGWPRASCTRTATCSRTRSSSTATTCSEGELFHGMGEWAWAAGIAPLLGPWRLGAVQLVYQREGGFDPHRQLDVLSRHGATNVFTTPTAMRSMMGDRRRRHALPAEVPHRLQRRRAAQPRGDPLVPRAVRPHGARLLRADRVLSARRQLPVHGGPRGLDGQADAGLGRARSSTRTSGRCAAGERGEICLRARSNPHYPLGYWNNEEAARGDVRRRVVPHEGRRAASTRTATSGTRAAPTT